MTKKLNTSQALYEALESLRKGEYEAAESYIWEAFRAHQRFERQVNTLILELENDGS